KAGWSLSGIVSRRADSEERGFFFVSFVPLWFSSGDEGALVRAPQQEGVHRQVELVRDPELHRQEFEGPFEPLEELLEDLFHRQPAAALQLDAVQLAAHEVDQDLLAGHRPGEAEDARTPARGQHAEERGHADLVERALEAAS